MIAILCFAGGSSFATSAAVPTRRRKRATKAIIKITDVKAKKHSFVTLKKIKWRLFYILWHLLLILWQPDTLQTVKAKSDHHHTSTFCSCVFFFSFFGGWNKVCFSCGLLSNEDGFIAFYIYYVQYFLFRFFSDRLLFEVV
jgi:hypothetical protein